MGKKATLKLKRVTNAHKIVLLEDRLFQLEQRVATLEAQQRNCIYLSPSQPELRPPYFVQCGTYTV